jgi:hypothetical protein
MKKYRKIPVVIRAEQVSLINLQDLVDEINSNCLDRRAYLSGNSIHIKTLEGVMQANIGDYIIKGVKGEYYPCKEDIFNQTYVCEDITIDPIEWEPKEMVSEQVCWERYTKILPEGNRGRGGEYSRYRICNIDSRERLAELHFQNEPVDVVGVNGINNEDLLYIVLHRLECFQDGEFKNQYNQVAIAFIAKALVALNKRTEDRIARGVEGLYAK